MQVFAEPGDMALLGVRTLEGFGVMADTIAHRFVVTTMAALPSSASHGPRALSSNSSNSSLS
jgi:hypothetical protein